MVPKLHARGTSFKGASAYLFHDKNRAKTSERVAWAEALNCWSERPDDAWFEMWDTWKERHALKREAGIPPGGRDNRNPVLHFSLSWHPDEKPTAERMKIAAREALKVLGLDEHQAVILAHNDEPHPHVHVLVNTVHRFTGQTAKMTYSKEALSRWAEDFERDAGTIRCEERVKNNERRRELKKERQAETAQRDFDVAAARTPKPKKPFAPVKDRTPPRKQWFDRQQIIDRMKALRADQKFWHVVERDRVWSRHLRERNALDATTKAKVDAVRDRVSQSFRPVWRDMYREHKAEMRHLDRNVTHPFERAAFVFANRHRLTAPGKSLSVTGMVRLILSGARLTKAVVAAQERERRSVASDEKSQAKTLTDFVWTAHREQFQNLKARQDGERAAQRAHHSVERESITFARAKDELAGRDTAPPAPEADRAPAPSAPVPTNTAKTFNDVLRNLFSDAAPAPAPTVPEKRSERIARQMQDTQKRTKGRDDFERDM